MTAARLGKLIDPAAAADLLRSGAALAPGAGLRLLDLEGVVIVETQGMEAAPVGARVADRIRVPLAVDGDAIGSVEVTGAGPGGPAIARLIGQAIAMTAGEALRRRAVGAAAIRDLRELSLLSRLSAILGDSVDPAAIAGRTLSTVSRPLDAAAGIVLGPDDRTALARSGDGDDADRLGSAAALLIQRLRDEDPAGGTGAATEDSPAGPFASILVAFLATARGHQGTIVLGRPPGARPFTAIDHQLLAAVAGQAAVAIERAILQQQVAERRAFDHELEIGRRIQLSLMPRRFLEVPGWEIASAYEPAREVGGDFYDVFPLRDRPGIVGLVVADVTGKGIPAAILMADSRALIHAAADHGDDPADTLARVNRILVSERASGLFVTVVHAVLDVEQGRLRLASAGHDPVHVLRADGRIEILDPPGRLVGMVEDIVATSMEVTLDPGDTWIGHTDGVTEARDAAGGFYGEERFRDLLAGLAGRSASEIVVAIVRDVASLRGVAEPSDDLTVLVVRRAVTADKGDPG